ncbi:hypothetical protein NOR_05371 [Metarhizium rileyi]|uniref:Methyltransferase type 11 domain-containing protein n=1 Tax=Metarhizium rileyi (strain RCEF 4871) TaxID=1649241 RepID=A0A162JFF3_METRR|nr:hypothetical protein NOR_05371 [Metarhizium rileyi RCEF 4871]
MAQALSSGDIENGFDESRQAYLLSHSQREVQRMKNQHEWVKTAFGGLIKAPIDYEKKDQSILDSATADGDPELYPPSHLLPSNVQLVPGDLLTSLPDSWTRNFDLVHQRFVFPGIPSEAFHDALWKLMECVKPGGWIQLVEPLAGENVSGPGPSAFAVLHRLANKFMKSSNIEQRITSRLQEGGFININVQMMDIVLGKSQQNKELDVRGRKTMRAALVNMSSMTNAKEMGMSDEEWGSLMERFDRDMMTFCIAVRHVIIWAQRPE